MDRVSRGVRARPPEPQYRVTVNIPTNWCLTCELTLRTEEEYFAHIDLFPTHHVKAIDRLICPA